MKKLIVLLFMLVLVFSSGLNAQERGPEAISPGIETGVAVVSQNCPTFSWSSVPWAKSYRIIVFKSSLGVMAKYEDMETGGVAVLNKEIIGPALSWTPSETEGLVDGEEYVWYVEAIDKNGLGEWSEGRMFRVEEGEVLKQRVKTLFENLIKTGLQENKIVSVVQGLDLTENYSQAGPEKQSFALSENYSRIQGYEGDSMGDTYYGYAAGPSLLEGWGFYNSFFGCQAGRFTSDGDSNTFFGYQAGYSNTAGSWNTMIGGSAGYHAQTVATDNANSNVYLGFDAGLYNTTGDNNVFIGVNSGYGDALGPVANNTFIGYFSGFHNTASENVFVGYYSGSKNDGTKNSFLGYEAGKNNNDGSNNTFLGYQAGLTNDTSNNNTFIGSEAGSNNTGDDNVFLGNKAGQKNDTGEENVFIGKLAGNTNLEGQRNTYVGTSSGFNSTGNGNVLIGYRAGYDHGGSNKLFIDNSNTSEPLIWGDFYNNVLTAHGRFGLNTKVPGFTAEFDTTGENCALVLKRTDGAVNYVNATSNFGNFGTVNDYPLRLAVNRLWRMRLDNNNSLTMKNGATCTAGGVWTDASSRDYKEDIENLSTKEAIDALDELNPVKYRYKTDKEEEHLGFIAEDVPDLVAMKDRKGMSPMDVVAVLTKVVQNQQETLNEQQKTISQLKDMIQELKKEKESK